MWLPIVAEFLLVRLSLPPSWWSSLAGAFNSSSGVTGFRGHHTQVVITTVLGWFLSALVTSIDPRGVSSATYLIACISGPLALGIRIFGHPPPVEDADGNGEQV
jgi:hypothetical protein